MSVQDKEISIAGMMEWVEKAGAERAKVLERFRQNKQIRARQPWVRGPQNWNPETGMSMPSYGMSIYEPNLLTVIEDTEGFGHMGVTHHLTTRNVDDVIGLINLFKEFTHYVAPEQIPLFTHDLQLVMSKVKIYSSRPETLSPNEVLNATKTGPIMPLTGEGQRIQSGGGPLRRVAGTPAEQED